MDISEIKQRLELALRPVEKPPTLEEVLEQVSTRGVLRGPVDWVFPAWMLYVEYATQRIAETFPLSEEEKRQLFHFRDTMKQLLLEAWMQTKEKLAALYKAVAEGTYRLEGKRLYAPDGTWMEKTNLVPRISIHNIGTSAYFPNVLKLPRERLELLQLGWRASDEGKMGSGPVMATTQPWQILAWTALRYGDLYIRIASVNLTREGVSITIRVKARDWSQKWRKDEAIDLVVSYFRRGEWAPLLTMWLGDGTVNQKKILHGKYQLVIATKESQKLGINMGRRLALVATGREAFVKLREAAGIYGVLFDVLNAHKWIGVKLATDDALRATYKLKMTTRKIDVLRKMYGQFDEIFTESSYTERQRIGVVVVAGVVLRLELVKNSSGSLRARRYFRDVRKALTAAKRLESAGLRPNIVRSKANYVVYVSLSDLLKLAERDETIRKAIALYLAEKAKNGTPKQREIVEIILKRYPLFSIYESS
jgi:hypothetical protein